MTETWADRPFASFDIESTGVDTETARIVTASLVTITGGSPHVREWLIDPGVEIPAEATAVHGITTEHAREHGVRAAYAVAEIRQALSDALYDGRPLVIYNASYDLTLMDRECVRHGVDPLGAARVPLRVVDPLVLDRAMDPYRRGPGTRRLTYVCQHVYGVPLSDEDAHGSTADALAAARVAWKIAKRYPQVGEADIDALQVMQRDWHRAWADNFGAFLARQGKSDDVDRAWPVRPYVTAEVSA